MPFHLQIPVQVVVRSVSGSLSQSVDLLLPGGWGLDFWIALQFSGAKAAAQRDQRQMDFEAGRMSFPADYPDSAAGQRHEAMETGALQVG
jgi:POPLD (NUC188) domain